MESWNGKLGRCVTSCVPAQLINLTELSWSQLFWSFLGTWKRSKERQTLATREQDSVLNGNKMAGRLDGVTLHAYQSLPPWIRDVRCVGDKSCCRAGWKWKADLPLQQQTSSPIVKMSWLIKVHISLKSKGIPKRRKRSGLHVLPRVLPCL